MKRQGLMVSINELEKLIKKLKDNFEFDGVCYKEDYDGKFQINIINKKGLSDTWEIEKFKENRK